MTRAISSAVDATVFLLLVGGAIGTLAWAAGPAPAADRDPAATTARVVATTTASVNYTVPVASGPASEGGLQSAGDGEVERTARGTVASLLADAAVANLTVDDRPVTPGDERYVAAVRAAAWSHLDRPRERTEIVVRWTPYPGGPVDGSVRLGTHPPPAADVRAATLTTASPVGVDSAAVAAAGRSAGFAGVARVYATGVVEGLFPPNATRLALRQGRPTDAAIARRYRRVADAVGADEPPLGSESVVAANRALVDALADRFAADLRDRYGSPTAVLGDHSGREVRITVRTWSR